MAELSAADRRALAAIARRLAQARPCHARQPDRAQHALRQARVPLRPGAPQLPGGRAGAGGGQRRALPEHGAASSTWCRRPGFAIGPPS